MRIKLSGGEGRGRGTGWGAAGKARLSAQDRHDCHCQRPGGTVAESISSARCFYLD